MNVEESGGLTWTDTAVSLACSSLAGFMYSVSQCLPAGELKQALFLSLFVIPAVWVVTLVIVLPFLHFAKKREWTHPFTYTVLPGLLVLILSVVPHFDSTFSVISVDGRKLVANGDIVWENFGWLVLYHSEPAWWAFLAGAVFWLLRIRHGQESL